jgi:hypothetical protein
MDNQTTETKKVITFEDIENLLDKSYTLSYVDRNDDLSNSLDKVQKAIHGDYEELDEMTFDNWDTQDSEQEALSELNDAIQSKFGIDENEAQELIDEHEDNLKDKIRELDDSDVLKDLLRNTREQVFFYDTCVEVGEYDSFKDKIRIIKKALKIKQKDTTFDKNLEDLVNNASYGGRLVIYFYDNIAPYLNLDDKINKITFSGKINVALIHNGNGSGFDVSMDYTLSLPFVKENLFLDKTVSYSYTYDVCGMSSDWCESTKIKLEVGRKTKKVVEASVLNNHIEEEKRLDEVFKKGGCTFGDMKYSRHRDKVYINEFPCGTHCSSCKTFWID